MRVGLFLRHLDEEFQITVFAGVRARAQERGIDLLCLQSEPFQAGTGGEDRPFALAHASGCDGFLILTPVLTHLSVSRDNSFLKDLLPWGPVVSVGMRVPGCPSVVFQSRQSLRRIVVHLVMDHGYRRLLFIGGPEHHRDSRDRLRVVRECLGELGAWQPGLTLDVVYAGFTEYSVQAVLNPLLGGQPYDAIITANDNMAIGALRILNLEAGDAWSHCAVTGFDDIPQAAFTEPALTSVHQPLDRLGARSLDMLLDVLTGEKTAQTGSIPCWPMIRESCGCSAAAVPAPVPRAPVPWGPGQRLAVEADRWLRAANYLAGDLGMAEARAEVWSRLDGYLATLGLTDLALLESSAPSPELSSFRIVFHRRNGQRVELGASGKECAGLGELLDSLDHPGGGSWDYTVAPLRSGPRSNGLAVYSAPLNVHPYVGAVLPHVSHSLRRLHEMEEQKLRNLILEEMVQERTRELMQANDQLRAQRRGLETILRTLPMPLVLFRASDRRILYANPAFERVVGAEPDHRPVDAFLTVPEVCEGLELGLTTASGEPAPVLAYRVPIEFEEQPAVLVAMVDLSRQRALESEVLQASEWERRRFGLELHDDICQRLAGIVMYLKGLQNRKVDLGSAAGEVTAMVDEALHLTRQYSHASFPMELETRGLVSALATLCESVETRTGRRVRLTAPDEAFDVRDPQKNLNIYRIVQEALHNASKHSLARNIEVSLARGTAGLTVRVSDDGKGMAGHGDGPSGLGLRSMAYRAAQMGARLDIHNHPGEGVVVTLEVF